MFGTESPTVLDSHHSTVKTLQSLKMHNGVLRIICKEKTCWSGKDSCCFLWWPTRCFQEAHKQKMKTMVPSCHWSYGIQKHIISESGGSIEPGTMIDLSSLLEVFCTPERELRKSNSCCKKGLVKVFQQAPSAMKWEALGELSRARFTKQSPLPPTELSLHSSIACIYS